MMLSNHLLSAAPFSFCRQSFSASRSSPMHWLFPSGGQSIGASGSASVPQINSQCWFPLGLACLIPLLSKGLSRVFFSSTIQKHQVFSAQSSLWSNSHIHTWLLIKPKVWQCDYLLVKQYLCFLICCLVLSADDRGQQRMKWLDGITNAMDMNLGKLWKMVGDREVCHAAVHGVTESDRTWQLNNS